MQRKQTGSVLVLVMVLALVGSLALLGVQHLAYRSNSRIAQRVSEKQAFYLARSTAEALVDQITYTDGAVRPFSSQPGHNTPVVSGLSEEMGQCKLDLYLEEWTPDGSNPNNAAIVARQITVTATATHGKASHTTKIVLRNYRGEVRDLTRARDMVDYYVYSYES